MPIVIALPLQSVLIIALTPLLVITLMIWLLNRQLPVQICPVCVSVSGTWLLLNAGILFGYIQSTDFLPIILLLMGGTIVGIAYQGEKSLAWAAQNTFRWKLLIIIIGMPLALWATKNLSFKVLIFEAMILFVLAYLFFFRSPSKKQTFGNANFPPAKENYEKIKTIENKLKDCC